MQRIVLLCSPKQLSGAIIHFTQMAQEGVIQHCLRLSSLPRWHPANVHFQPRLFTFQPVSVCAPLCMWRGRGENRMQQVTCVPEFFYMKNSDGQLQLHLSDVNWYHTHTYRQRYTHTCTHIRTHTDTKQPAGLQWVSTAATCFAILWSMQRMQHLIILIVLVLGFSFKPTRL